MNKRFLIGLVMVFVTVGLTGFTLAVNGATVVGGANQTAPNDSATSISAYAGNLTEVTITATSTTQSWQGYFGNVSGVIQLADGNDNVMYNWSLASPDGEVYVSTNNSISWGNIQCFNMTANGTEGGIAGEVPGNVSVGGLNATGLETLFNLNASASDGVNETFSTNNHNAFYTGSLEFSTDECSSVQLFDYTNKSVDGKFEEALLYEPSTGSVVFTSLLNSADTRGFNSGYQDFQMIVLEDGHGTDTDVTPYYFYVEIE